MHRATIYQIPTIMTGDNVMMPNQVGHWLGIDGFDTNLFRVSLCIQAVVN